MNQVYENYSLWEDYLNGMYNTENIKEKDKKVINAINLLSNDELFTEVMNELIKEWPIATAVNLTNNSINKKAWLGAAACMYFYETNEFLTRIAWNLLDKEIQDKANVAAEKIINDYLNIGNGNEKLFD